MDTTRYSSFTEAQNAAADFTDGGTFPAGSCRLASIQSQIEQDTVAALIAAESPIGNLWIGGTIANHGGGCNSVTECAEEGWIWSDGSAWTYQNWNWFEPNNGGSADENRVSINPSNYRWNDVTADNANADGGAVFKCSLPFPS